MLKFNSTLLTCAAAALLCACSSEGATISPDESATIEDEDVDRVAYAQLYNPAGELVADARFVPIHNGVDIEVEVYDLPPGLHGFHIHETGSCVGPDFKSAGGHFNPMDADHGMGDADGAHLGDLPNLPVGTDGEAQTSLLVSGVNIEPVGARSLMAGDGAALVVHAEADDYETDPAGDAGQRIACGIIEYR